MHTQATRVCDRAALRARRMSAKLFNCTPAQLPADLKANLVSMLQCGVNALEGYIRPGCVHLVRLKTQKKTLKPWVVQCGVNALEGYIRPGCVHLVRARAAPLHGLPAAPRDERAALLMKVAQGDRVQGQRHCMPWQLSMLQTRRARDGLWHT